MEYSSPQDLDLSQRHFLLMSNVKPNRSTHLEPYIIVLWVCWCGYPILCTANSYDGVAMKNCSNSNLVVVVSPTATDDFDLNSETTVVNETWLMVVRNHI